MNTIAKKCNYYNCDQYFRGKSILCPLHRNLDETGNKIGVKLSLKKNNEDNTLIKDLELRLLKKRIYSDVSRDFTKKIINKSINNILKKNNIEKIKKENNLIEKNRLILSPMNTNITKNNIKNIIDDIPNLLHTQDIEFVEKQSIENAILDEYEFIPNDNKIYFYGLK